MHGLVNALGAEVAYVVLSNHPQLLDLDPAVLAARCGGVHTCGCGGEGRVNHPQLLDLDTVVLVARCGGVIPLFRVGRRMNSCMHA